MIIWVFCCSTEKKKPKAPPRSLSSFSRVSNCIRLLIFFSLVVFFLEMKINIIFVIFVFFLRGSFFFSPHLETMQLKSNYILPMDVARCVHSLHEKPFCFVVFRSHKMIPKWLLRTMPVPESCRRQERQKKRRRAWGDAEVTFNSWNSSSDLFSPKHGEDGGEGMVENMQCSRRALDVFSGISYLFFLLLMVHSPRNSKPAWELKKRSTIFIMPAFF